jgi:hypothetical protein
MYDRRTSDLLRKGLEVQIEQEKVHFMRLYQRSKGTDPTKEEILRYWRNGVTATHQSLTNGLPYVWGLLKQLDRPVE